MRTAFVIGSIFFVVSCSLLSTAGQTEAADPKPIIDGTGAFGKALVAKLDADPEGRLKKNIHPFVVGYCGWRVRALTNYSLTKYDGMQIGLCRAILNSFDAEITETLTTIEKNATSMTKPIVISGAESKAIQDFVVMKYGMYYMNLDPGDAAKTPDTIARWKYEVGSNLGEIAAHLIIWWRIWTNEKFEAHVASLLAGLDDDLKSVPKGVNPAFVTNLRKLNSLGAKTKFASVERRQVNDLLTETMVSAIALSNLANIKEPMPASPGNLFSRSLSSGMIRTVNDLIENGKSLSAKGDHKAAVAQLDQAIELDPANAIAYFQRARAREKTGAIDDAIRDYSAVILLRGSLREAYFNRGTIFLNKKEYKSAIADFDMAINIDPKYVAALYNRGLAHYNTDNFIAAMTDFNNVLKTDPQHVNSLIMRSYVYCAQGLSSSAMKDQQQALLLGGKFQAGCK